MTSEDLQERSRCPYGTATLRGRPGGFQGSLERSAENLVYCTYCLHTQKPAAKTCVTCDASMCLKHLLVHTSSTDHDICEPTDSTRDRKCDVHMEPLTYYCCEDSSLLCHHCLVVGDHKGHLVETLREASEKKKERLGKALRKRRQREERTRKRIENLQERITDIDARATNITDHISSFFMDMREQLNVLERQMLQEVSEQQQKVIGSICQQIQELEVKMENLSKQISYAEELCRLTDPLSVMRGQEFGNSSTCLEQEAARRMSDEPNRPELDQVFISLTLRKNLMKIVKKGMRRFDVLEASDMVLNANTAGDFVFILGDRKTAYKSRLNLSHPQAPEKFYCPQVLSSMSFSCDRRSWEVEVGSVGDWMIGVTYASIDRTGRFSYFGMNDKSWCLQKSNGTYFVKHHFVKSPVDAESTCHRFFIYLDYDAGHLSFYQLSNPINHLHTFKANFTEPLHAAFNVDDDAWVRIQS